MFGLVVTINGWYPNFSPPTFHPATKPLFFLKIGLNRSRVPSKEISYSEMLIGMLMGVGAYVPGSAMRPEAPSTVSTVNKKGVAIIQEHFCSADQYFASNWASILCNLTELRLPQAHINQTTPSNALASVFPFRSINHLTERIGHCNR